MLPSREKTENWHLVSTYFGSHTVFSPLLKQWLQQHYAILFLRRTHLEEGKNRAS